MEGRRTVGLSYMVASHALNLVCSVPYAALAEVFERIDSTTKRLEIAAYLTNFLQSVIERTPDDLIKVVYLCINRVSLTSS